MQTETGGMRLVFMPPVLLTGSKQTNAFFSLERNWPLCQAAFHAQRRLAALRAVSPALFRDPKTARAASSRGSSAIRQGYIWLQTEMRTCRIRMGSQAPVAASWPRSSFGISWYWSRVAG